jgi:hypothetical protein
VNYLESWLATLGIGREQLKAALGEVSFGRIAGFFTSLLIGLAGAFSNLHLLLLIVLFMGLDAVYFSRRLARSAASGRQSSPRWVASSTAPGPTWWSPRSSG